MYGPIAFFIGACGVLIPCTWVSFRGQRSVPKQRRVQRVPRDRRPVREIAADLGAPPEERVDAIAQLNSSDDEALLVQILESRNPDVRAAAVAKLGDIGGRCALIALRGLETPVGRPSVSPADAIRSIRTRLGEAGDETGALALSVPDVHGAVSLETRAGALSPVKRKESGSGV